MLASFLLLKPAGQFGAHRPADLAPLSAGDPPLARAITRARLYFCEEDLTAAIEGCSKTAILTSIDDEPAFLNAAMIADIMAGNDIPAD
jgi:hypothetical protein